jgi:hypothetical protein
MLQVIITVHFLALHLLHFLTLYPLSDPPLPEGGAATATAGKLYFPLPPLTCVSHSPCFKRRRTSIARMWVGMLWCGAVWQQHPRDAAVLLTALQLQYYKLLPWQQTRECNNNVEVKQKIALLGWRGGWTIVCRAAGNKNMTWPM